MLGLMLLNSVQAQPLRIAMEGQFPPFEQIDATGQLRGFNVDIAQALCQAMAVECQLLRFAWDDLIPALDTQRADLILASMSITPVPATGGTGSLSGTSCACAGAHATSNDSHNMP